MHPAQQHKSNSCLSHKTERRRCACGGNRGDGERQADPRTCIAFSPKGVPESATWDDELKACCSGLATWVKAWGGTKALAMPLAASKHIEVLREIMFAAALYIYCVCVCATTKERCLGTLFSWGSWCCCSQGADVQVVHCAGYLAIS